MSISESKSNDIFRELYKFYIDKSNVPVGILIDSMDEGVLKSILAVSDAGSMFIWLFSQLYDHWIVPSKGFVDESFCPTIRLQELIVDHLMAMITEIEQGLLEIVPLYDPNDTAADIPYRVSNGWMITVYSRLYCWHRLESFVTPDNILFDPWLMTEENLKDRIFNHSPSADIQRNIYGFKQVV